MNERLKEMNVAVFVDLTTSNAPVPDGSSVSALFGSLSAALTGMVAGLTVGKKKYTEVEAEMCEVATAAGALKKELVEEIDRDSDSLNEFMAVMALLKNTDEEKTARKAAMQNGLKSAAKIPCHIAEITARIFPLTKTVVERGNTNVVTDGLVAAMAARATVIGAGLNMKINLASVGNEDFVAEYSARVAVFGEQATAAEREILTLSGLTREI